MKDHLSDLCEDGALGVCQIHPPDACVSHTALVLVLGLLRLDETNDADRKQCEDVEAAPNCQENRCVRIQLQSSAVKTDSGADTVILPSAEPPPPASSSSPAVCSQYY